MLEGVIISLGVPKNKGLKTIMPTRIDKEEAFADLVRDYEDQWVAVIEDDGVQFVVGNGPTAVEAAKQATKRGHSQARLFKVPSFSVRLVY